MIGAALRYAMLSAPVLLAALGLWGKVGPAPRPIYQGPAWPTFGHLLGIDATGRDFLSVLSAGASDFVLPGMAAVALLLLALTIQSWITLQRPVLPEGELNEASSALAAASPPRLLIVLVGMLMLDEPSPTVAASIVAALYFPVALNEISTHLRSLREQEVLAGAMAHGLPIRYVVVRYLLGGYLREPIARHAAALFTQVAFTQIALSYLFGASAMTAGLGVSWGMEFRHLASQLPGSAGALCLPGKVCAPHVAAFHWLALLGASLFLLGSLFRMSQPRTQAVT